MRQCLAGISSSSFTARCIYIHIKPRQAVRAVVSPPLFFIDRSERLLDGGIARLLSLSLSLFVYRYYVCACVMPTSTESILLQGLMTTDIRDKFNRRFEIRGNPGTAALHTNHRLSPPFRRQAERRTLYIESPELQEEEQHQAFSFVSPFLLLLSPLLHICLSFLFISQNPTSPCFLLISLPFPAVPQISTVPPHQNLETTPLSLSFSLIFSAPLYYIRAHSFSFGDPSPMPYDVAAASGCCSSSRSRVYIL